MGKRQAMSDAEVDVMIADWRAKGHTFTISERSPLAALVPPPPSTAPPQRKKRRRAKVDLFTFAVRPIDAEDRTGIAFVAPLHLEQVMNGGKIDRSAIGRSSWQRDTLCRSALAKLHREFAELAAAVSAGGMVVKFIRLGPDRLDTDNLPPTAKYVRDEIAQWLGVDDGPDGPVKWEYDQEQHDLAGVRVEITRPKGDR